MTTRQDRTCAKSSKLRHGTITRFLYQQSVPRSKEHVALPPRGCYLMVCTRLEKFCDAGETNLDGLASVPPTSARTKTLPQPNTYHNTGDTPEPTPKTKKERRLAPKNSFAIKLTPPSGPLRDIDVQGGREPPGGCPSPWNAARNTPAVAAWVARSPQLVIPPPPLPRRSRPPSSTRWRPDKQQKSGDGTGGLRR